MPKEKFQAGQMLTTNLMDGFVQQTQVLHSRGSSQEDMMSQKAITAELDKILNADDRIIYQDKTGKIRKAEHIPKSATVVVGLAERGYTEDEVDVLIRPSDDVKTKIEEAVEKLGSGGEIKLLEGTYDFNNNMCEVGGDTEKEVRLTGCGSATKLKRVLLHFSGGSASDFSIEPMESAPDVIWFSGSRTKLKLSDLFFPGVALIRYLEDSNDKQLIIDHCDPVGEIYGRTLHNWRNIFINGVAEYVFSNTYYKSTKRSRNTTTLQNVEIGAGDEISLVVHQAQIYGYETCSWTVSKTFSESGYIGTPFLLDASCGSIACFVNLEQKTMQLFTTESNWDAVKDAYDQCYIEIREIKFRRYLK